MPGAVAFVVHVWRKILSHGGNFLYDFFIKKTQKEKQTKVCVARKIKIRMTKHGHEHSEYTIKMPLG